jgi:hypothetical protein
VTRGLTDESRRDEFVKDIGGGWGEDHDGVQMLATIKREGERTKAVKYV